MPRKEGPRKARRALFAAACLVALGGCLDDVTGGSTEGVTAGDMVAATLAFENADTGETLIENATVQFEVGSGDSGLGESFEEEIEGLEANDTTTVEVPALEWSQETQEVNASFGPSPLVGSINQSQFEEAFGPAEPGKEFTPPGAFYPYRVEEVAAGNVTYRALPEDGQRDKLPQLGSIVITRVNEENESLTQILEPVDNATFTIQPPSPFQPSTPLGLEPGSYLVVGGEPGRLVLRHHPSQFADAIGHPLRVEVVIDEVQEPPPEGAGNDTGGGLPTAPLPP